VADTTTGLGEDTGVTVMLTPVQLYAMLNGMSISEGELSSNTWSMLPLPRDLPNLLPKPGLRADAWSRQTHYSQPNPPDCWMPPAVRRPSAESFTRATALLEIVGGGLELAGGALLLLTPEPTMLTKIGGSALTLQGLDVTQAALRQLFSGQPVEGYVPQGASMAARRMGASDSTARRVGVILDVAVPLVVGGVLGVERVLAIRAGRIILPEEAIAGKAGRVSLDAEEAAGGHTLDMHVNKSPVDILERAATRDGDVSRFLSKKLAEDAINDAIRAKHFEIQQWAKNPKPIRMAFDFPCKTEIGHVFNMATGRFVDVKMVRIVFKFEPASGRSFYLLTAYPIR
jgi:hypothetical protein